MNTLYKITVKAFLTLGLVIGMGSLSQVSASDFPADLSTNTEISEETLTVEDWMMNLNEWQSFELEKNLITRFEAELGIENWMLEANECNWSLTENIEKEEELEVENWMCDLSKW